MDNAKIAARIERDSRRLAELDARVRAAEQRLSSMETTFNIRLQTQQALLALAQLDRNRGW